MATIHLELMQNVQNLINDIKHMTSRLYEGQTNDGLNKLQDIIDGLGHIADEYAALFSKTDSITKFNLILSNANQAIVNNDFILFADIFEYEVVIILDEIMIDLKSQIIN